MAYAITNARATAPSASLGFYDRVRAMIVERRVYRQTIKELSRLDDRELNDIGISRYDIRRIAADTARGRRV